MVNESQQGEIDEPTKLILVNMKYKSMSSRLADLEKAFENISVAPNKAPLII